MVPSLNIISLNTIDSTHLYAKRNALTLQSPSLITALEQTQGIGQRGKHWISPRGNFTGTFVVKDLDLPIHIRNQLSIVIACSIVHYFKSEDFYDFKIKWPNDIYNNALTKKIAGILIDAEDDFILISVGINKIEAPRIEYPTTSLQELKAITLLKHWDDNTFFAYIWKDLIKFKQSGLHSFIKKWEENCGHMNKKINLYDGRCGLFLGLNDDGDAHIES